MKRETSCGGLVVNDGKVLILYSRKFEGYSIPKGHIDEGERCVDCARREVMEETGLDIKRLGDFEKSITYRFEMFDTLKTVILFLFESTGRDISPYELEVHEGPYDYLWCDHAQAVKLAAYINSGPIILEGLKELKKMGKL
ncbi:NUDIX domain-containing protein [Nanoarchaeota archaeon]